MRENEFNWLGYALALVCFLGAMLLIMTGVVFWIFIGLALWVISIVIFLATVEGGSEESEPQRDYSEREKKEETKKEYRFSDFIWDGIDGGLSELFGE